MQRFAVVLLALLTVVSFSFAYSSGPPSGHAGDPPANANCTACHSSFPLNSGDGELSITELLEYTPGQSYDLTISLTDPGQSRWGFQTTARNGSNQFSGTLSLVTPATTQLNSGYINHTTAGTNSGSGAGNSWTISWTAPPAGTGPVTFYVAGNAANNNFDNTGDDIYTINMVVQEAAGGAPDISVDPGMLAFGEVTVGETETLAVTVGNNGDAALVISALNVIGAAFSVQETAPIEVAAGEETTLHVDFTPSASTPFQGQLIIVSNDPDESSVELNLSGSGAANLPPASFALLSPEDGSMLLPDGPITFSWEASSDPEGGDVSYMLQVSESDDFATLLFDVDTDANEATLNDPGLTDGATYFWRVIAVDDGEAETECDAVFSFTAQAASVGEPGSLPGGWAIAAAYPNPFNPALHVVVDVAGNAPVTVAVYDMLGRRVATLQEGVLGVGRHTMSWSPEGSAGVYLLVARADGWSESRKVVYMK